MAARWQEDTLSIKPNFLSILIGVNDTTQTGDEAETVEQFKDTYDKLLAATMGVQRDGAMTEYITVPVDRVYTANLSLKELALAAQFLRWRAGRHVEHPDSISSRIHAHRG